MVVGSRGGPRIITGTSQLILDVIAHRMTLADAFAAPRMHHQALPDVLLHERNGLSPEVMAALQRMGLTLQVGSDGLPNGIMRVAGRVARDGGPARLGKRRGGGVLNASSAYAVRTAALGARR